MAEFFQLDWGEKNSAPVPLRSQCDACGLYRRCRSPKMPVDGQGRKGILIVSEFPGHEEDQYGKPLVGNTGKEVQSILRKCGIDMRRDCWLTNALLCHPNGKAPNGATEFCRPNLLQTIKELKPRVIILMGGMAVQSLIGHLWKPSIGSVERWVGWQIPCRVNNAWVCPTYQPAWMFRNNDPVLRMDLDRHLADAVALEGRPWDDGIPDYEKEIEIIFSPTEAAGRLQEYVRGTLTFDYETNCLKPWSRGKIYSCSVCWEGKETIAFPWSGPVIEEMKRILGSCNIRKWGWNCFSGETRFLTREHGVVSFRDVVGKKVTVLNREGKWVSADILSFGEQETVQASFCRRNYVNSVWVTRNHRWILEDGTETQTSLLKSGRKGQKKSGQLADRISCLKAPKIVVDYEEYIAGVRHGAVFGDGTRRTDRKNTFNIRLCGDKKELLPFFDGFSRSYPQSYGGDPIVYMPRQEENLKKPPLDSVSNSYLVGFVRGLLATDGTVTRPIGQISITGTREIVDWLEKHAPRVGYWFQNSFSLRKYADRYDGGYGVAEDDWTIYFSRESVVEDDLLRAAHRERYKKVDLGSYRFSQLNGSRVEEVFCAVVPEGESFVLDGGLLTGNCKFEDLWTREKLGLAVEEQEWDGMLASHALDPRGNKDGEKRKDQAGITGLKFQSYVLLGMGDYNSHIEPYLHSNEKSGYALNRIHEIDKHELLKYNALDSLLEWEVCHKQQQRMGKES